MNSFCFFRPIKNHIQYYKTKIIAPCRSAFPFFPNHPIHLADLQPHHLPELTQHTRILISMIIDKDKDRQDKEDKDILLTIFALAVLEKPVVH